MYFDMKRDEAELQAAFAHFKQCENEKSCIGNSMITMSFIVAELGNTMRC